MIGIDRNLRERRVRDGEDHDQESEKFLHPGNCIPSRLEVVGLYF
jgi:hypothetical protein